MGRRAKDENSANNTSSKPASVAPKAAEQPPPPEKAKRTRNPNAMRTYIPRDPESRVRDPEKVKKLFKAFIAGASPSRVDYARLGADGGAVAGLLAQLSIIAFGQDGHGGFRKIAVPRPRRRSKAAELLKPGMIVRYKKMSEQLEIEEEAGKGPIVVVKVGAKSVRLSCNGIEYTPLISQIEPHPDAEQPGEIIHDEEPEDEDDGAANEVQPGDAESDEYEDEYEDELEGEED